MNNNLVSRPFSTILGIALLASVTFEGAAQSSDALIDKLVQKGILTVREANELREETDKNFTQAYSVKSGMPDWVTALKFNGDVRLRYDGIFVDPGISDRNRWRYRVRFGSTAVLHDNLEVGIRLGSGEQKSGALGNISGDSISGNDSYRNNASKKAIWLDLVFAKWTPINQPFWSLTLTGGKMENPFTFSDLVFDPDYTPEGFAINAAFNLSPKHILKFNSGAFILNEVGASSKDPFLFGAQARLESAWNLKWTTSFGVSLLSISDPGNLRNADVNDVNKGNTRLDAAGTLASSFNPIVVDAGVTHTLESFPRYPGAFPIRVFGDYVNNPAAGARNEAYALGVTFGKSGKRGTWDLTYKWKNLESDYWYEEVVDSDHGAFYRAAPLGGAAGYGPGTNIRGHYLRAAYSPYDSLTLSATYYLFELIDKPPGTGGANSQAGRLQVDAAIKF